MHEAYATRASDLGADPAWDNGPVIDRTLALRREAAQLLGYGNFAQVSLVPKMAKDPNKIDVKLSRAGLEASASGLLGIGAFVFFVSVLAGGRAWGLW